MLYHDLSFTAAAKRAAILSAMLLAGAAPAAASAAPTSQTFDTPGDYSFTVPAGVTSASFELDGGSGGSGRNSGPGGKGAHVIATLSVSPGETLAIGVAGAGASWDGGGTAGINGGGTGATATGGDFFGGGGGGASSVERTGASLLVAGGGGGSGAWGGAGGDSGAVGADGPQGAPGGGAATPLLGGAGGIGILYTACWAPSAEDLTADGQAGTAGAGGAGGGNSTHDLPAGGGGGGGVYGGGGGAAGAICPGAGVFAGAAGGGGGSSYVDAAASGAAVTEGARSGNGAVAITWNAADETVVRDVDGPAIAIAAPIAKAYKVGQKVVVDYSCSDESGVASCTGTVADGARLNTSAAGSFEFTVTATDNKGNTSRATVPYTVAKGGKKG